MEDGPSVTVPGYELEAKCGCGASSEVWIGHDFHGVHRAVRIVSKEGTSCAANENSCLASYRLFSEESAHLLHFWYAGETEECYYYVSDLADNIRGETDPSGYAADTLFYRLKTRRYSANGILCCVLDILCALEALHKRSLAHNDLKPENILFIRDRLKLADPGLLHPSDDKIRSGTEGFRPDWSSSGVESDLYALGKIIYCMITGSSDPDSFPELNADGLDRSFFPLNEIALRCCDRDPAVRYRNCAAVRHDVLKLLQRTKSGRKNMISPVLISFLIALCVLQSLCLCISICCSNLCSGSGSGKVQEYTTGTPLRQDPAGVSGVKLRSFGLKDLKDPGIGKSSFRVDL